MARTSKAGILAAAVLLISVMFAPGANAATTALNQMQTTPVADGIYTVQNNELGSAAAESITTNRNADFTVANSAIDNATNGAPGGSQGSFDTVSCTMTTPQTSVSGLDLAPLAQNAVSRGYLSNPAPRSAHSYGGCP